MSDAIFALLLCGVGGIFGSCLRITIGGRSGLFISCFAVAFLGGVTSKIIEASLFASTIGVGMALAMVLAYSCYYKYRFTQAIACAPRVANFGLNYFERLDVDLDGMITNCDLWDAAQLPDFSRQDLLMIAHIERNIEQIGHILGTTVISSPISPGVCVSHFGISREDFQRYPVKLHELYEREFCEKLA